MLFLNRSGSSSRCCTALLAGAVVMATLGGSAEAQQVEAVQVGTQSGLIGLGPSSYRYRLGPGDKLSMSVFKMDGYAAQVEVLSDGTINLPRLGTVSVWGLTLEQAKQLITDGYSEILRSPLVYLNLISPRPIKVSVTGHVERPGVFSMPTTGTDGWPTLVEAVQKAGGIAATGDLSKIELVRPAREPGGQTTTYPFDYLTVLRDGGQAPPPLIYDGDSVRVYTAEALENADMITTAASNFAPATININVVGEVSNPGVISLPSNAPMSRAILASGGITRRGSQSTVELIRVDGNGKPTIKKMGFNPGAVLSSPTNPPLRQGDVLVVNRNSLAKVTDGMNDVLTPLSPLIRLTSIFRMMGLPLGGLLDL